MKKSKKANVVTDNIFWVIIAVLVIVIVFFFLFQNTILDWFRNLPGHEYSNKDEVIENLTGDLEAQVNYYMVAVIQDGLYINFCTKNNCNDLRNSSLYWHGGEVEGEIYVDKNWALDKKVADVVNRRVKIDKEVLEGGDLYLKVKNQLPSYEDLRNLDDSIYISGILYRDKAVVVSDDEKEFGKTVVELPADRGASFSKGIRNLKVGEVLAEDGYFVFESVRMFSSENIYCNKIKIEKIGEDKFNIFALYSNPKGVDEWHKLDCNKNGWFGKTISYERFGDTLVQTLNENCEW